MGVSLSPSLKLIIIIISKLADTESIKGFVSFAQYKTESQRG